MNRAIWVIGIVLSILIIALVLIKLNEAKAQAAADQQAQSTDFRQQAQDAYSAFGQTSCGDNLEQCVKNWFKGGIHISSSMFLGAFA